MYVRINVYIYIKVESITTTITQCCQRQEQGKAKLLKKNNKIYTEQQKINKIFFYRKCFSHSKNYYRWVSELQIKGKTNNNKLTRVRTLLGLPLTLYFQ